MTLSQSRISSSVSGHVDPTLSEDSPSPGLPDSSPASEHASNSAPDPTSARRLASIPIRPLETSVVARTPPPSAPASSTTGSVVAIPTDGTAAVQVAEARAFFNGPRPTEATPEYFLEFWQHYTVMREQVFSHAASETAEMRAWRSHLRFATEEILDGVPALSSSPMQLAAHLALGRAYQELIARDPSHASDYRDGLEINLRNWLQALDEVSIPDTTATQQFMEWFQIARDSEMIFHLGDEAREFITARIGKLQEAARGEENPQAALSHLLLALQILNTVTLVVGGFEESYTEVSQEVASAALTLEDRVARAESPEQRLQILSRAVLIWDALNQNPDDQFAGDYHRATGALLQALQDESLPLNLRVQASYELAIQIGRNGDEARCREIVAGLRSQAADRIAAAAHPGDVEARIQLLNQARMIYAQVGTSAERDTVANQIREILHQVESRIAGSHNAAMLRVAHQYLAQNYLGLGDFGSAQSHLDSLRSIILGDSTVSAEDKGVALIQLGGLYQQLAQAQVEANGGEIDMSSFQGILADLRTLGNQQQVPTMARYAEWMQAVLEENFENADLLYFQLIPYQDGTRDSFQTLAESIHRQMALVRVGETPVPDRTAPTLHWLHLLIEGNYEHAIAQATEDELPTGDLVTERDQMRAWLRQIQSYVAGGRAATTRAAIELLQENDPSAREFFTHRLSAIIGQPFWDLIDSETLDDPNLQVEQRIRIAREMMRDDSINHHADAAVLSILAFVESHRGNRVLSDSTDATMQNLQNIINRTATLGDFSDVWDRVAGNLSLADRVASTRSLMPYYQTSMQVLNDTLSVEGGVILFASLLTAGIAGGIAEAATLARGGYAVGEAAPLLARLAAGTSGFVANFATYEGSHLGLTAGWRRINHRHQMTPRQIRTSLLSSAIVFGAIGALHGTAGRIVTGTLQRAGANEATLLAARFPVTVAGMITGEDISAGLRITPQDSSPTGVRLFRTVLMTLPLEIGTHAGRAIHEPVMEIAHEGLRRTAARHRGAYESLTRSARRAAAALERGARSTGRVIRDANMILAMGLVGGVIAPGGGFGRSSELGASRGTRFSPELRPLEAIHARGYARTPVRFSPEQFEQVTSALPSEATYRKNAENLHITILNDDELAAWVERVHTEEGLSRREAQRRVAEKFLALAQEIGLGEPAVTGVGSVTEGHTVYFATVEWEAAQRLRERLGLGRVDFHITLASTAQAEGGRPADIHGMRKNEPNVVAFAAAAPPPAPATGTIPALEAISLTSAEIAPAAPEGSAATQDYSDYARFSDVFSGRRPEGTETRSFDGLTHDPDALAPYLNQVATRGPDIRITSTATRAVGASPGDPRWMTRSSEDVRAYSLRAEVGEEEFEGSIGTHDRARMEELHRGVATVYERTGSAEEAIRWLRRAVRAVENDSPLPSVPEPAIPAGPASPPPAPATIPALETLTLTSAELAATTETSRIETIRTALQQYGAEHNLRGLEGRITRGLDPASMLAVPETRAQVEQIAQRLGASMADVIRLTNELHVGGIWRNAEALAAGSDPAVLVWMILGEVCVSGRTHQGDLNETQFLTDTARVEGLLNEASRDPVAFARRARASLIERSRQQFRVEDRVPVSDLDSGFLAMAVNGHSSGIVRATDGNLFVGAERLDYRVLERMGLRAEEREDRGRRSVFYVNADGEPVVKRLYDGLAIVLNGDIEVARALARTAVPIAAAPMAATPPAEDERSTPEPVATPEASTELTGFRRRMESLARRAPEGELRIQAEDLQRRLNETTEVTPELREEINTITREINDAVGAARAGRPVEDPTVLSSRDREDMELLSSHGALNAEAIHEIEAAMSWPNAPERIRQALRTATGYLRPRRGSPSPIAAIRAYDCIQGLRFELSRIRQMSEALGLDPALGSRETSDRRYLGTSENGERVTRRVTVENDIPVIDGHIWEVKWFQRRPAGSDVDLRNQALRYETLVRSGEYRAATIEISGNVDPNFISWMAANAPHVEVLYNLTMPGGREIAFPIRQARALDGATERPASLARIHPSGELRADEQVIVQGIQRALELGRIGEIFSNRLLTEADIANSPRVLELREALREGTVDPEQIHDLGVFREFETLMGQHRLGILREMAGEDAARRATEWQRRPVTEEFIDHQLEAIREWLGHASVPIQRQYMIENPQMAAAVRVEFARRLQTIAARESARYAAESADPSVREARAARGYRGPEEGYPLDPLHIYMDTVKTVRRAASASRRGTAVAPASIGETGFRSIDLADHFTTADQILGEVRGGRYGEERTTAEIYYPRGTIEPERSVTRERDVTDERSRTRLAEELLDLNLQRFGSMRGDATIPESIRRGLEQNSPRLEAAHNEILRIRAERETAVRAADRSRKQEVARSFDTPLRETREHLLGLYREILGERQYLEYAARIEREETSGRTKFIFTINAEGTLRMVEEGEVPGSERPAHSELAGGGNIYGAGEIYIRVEERNGVRVPVVESVSNGSGHYRPDAAENLAYVLSVLAEHGFDVSQAHQEQIRFPHVAIDRPLIELLGDSYISRLVASGERGPHGSGGPSAPPTNGPTAPSSDGNGSSGGAAALGASVLTFLGASRARAQDGVTSSETHATVDTPSDDYISHSGASTQDFSHILPFVGIVGGLYLSTRIIRWLFSGGRTSTPSESSSPSPSAPALPPQTSPAPSDVTRIHIEPVPVARREITPVGPYRTSSVEEVALYQDLNGNPTHWVSALPSSEFEGVILSTHENGRPGEVELRERQTVQGFSLPGGTVINFDKDGFLCGFTTHSGDQGDDLFSQGPFLVRGSNGIRVNRHGRIARGTVAEITDGAELHGLETLLSPISLGTSVAWDNEGNISAIFLRSGPTEMEIQGFPCRTRHLSFWPNGDLSFFILSRNYEIDGTIYPSGTRIQIDESGHASEVRPFTLRVISAR